VEPVVCLTFEQSIPIKSTEVFEGLSFTKGRENGYWLGPLRRSLQQIEDHDGQFLESLLHQQTSSPRSFPLTPEELSRYRTHQVKRADGAIEVTVPTDDSEVFTTTRSDRESFKIQADLARLGNEMGYKIWIPKNDRSAVLAHWTPKEDALLDMLPLNYDDTTLTT